MSTSLQAHSTVLKVVRQANPREDIRRQRVFAWVVTALLLSSSPHLSRWLVVIHGQAKAKSKLWRLCRWLCNGTVDVAAYYRPFIQTALAGWAGQDLRLAIDGTSPNGACVVVRMSLCFRGRALPLCWKTFDTRSHSIRYDWYVAVLDRALELIPEGCSVTLLEDRGFGHRRLMKWCGKAGWHYVLRLKADSIVILPDGSRRGQGHRMVHLSQAALARAGGAVGRTGRSMRSRRASKRSAWGIWKKRSAAVLPSGRLIQ